MEIETVAYNVLQKADLPLLIDVVQSNDDHDANERIITEKKSVQGSTKNVLGSIFGNQADGTRVPRRAYHDLYLSYFASGRSTQVHEDPKKFSEL